jgi:PAS domain S-box-containing protein
MAPSIERLADDPEIYRQSFRDSTDAIVITDGNGRIAVANQAWLDLYGYALDEVVGKTTSLIKSDHATSEMYRYMWSQIVDPAKGHWKGDIINRKKSGEEVPVLLTITPIRRDGVIIGYMGLGIDMSERARLEEMKDLYEMVVRHDLKAPLGNMIVLLQTLQDGYVGELAPAQRDFVERTLHSGRRMLEIIATSMDMEKLKRGTLRLEITDVDLFEIVRSSIETLSNLAKQRGVTLSLLTGGRPAADSDALVLRLDRVHLQRCTDNLIKNAIESAPAGSAVEVSVEERGSEARIRVHNEGAPIPPDVRATLFHPFSTYGKRGGTGLGLYGVKMAVESMGGRVDYETGEKGTAFELVFPMAPSSRAETA